MEYVRSCICEHKFSWGQKKGSALRTGVTSGCEQSCGCWEPDSVPLPEPSLQPLVFMNYEN